MSNLLTLIKAVEYVERKDREVEHGYACTLPMPTHMSSSYRKKLKPSNGITKARAVRGVFRSSHNELEKTRRANLRQHLEKLKAVVPLKSNATRHTTLGLLVDSKDHITKLVKHEKSLLATLESEERKRRQLSGRLTQLTSSKIGIVVTTTTDDKSTTVASANWYQLRTPNSASESSTSTVLSSLTGSEEPDDGDHSCSSSSAGYGSDSNESSVDQQQLQHKRRRERERHLLGVDTFSDSLSRRCAV